MIFLPHYLSRICIMLLLFCGDVWGFFLFESNVFHLLLCFLIVQIVYFRSTLSMIAALFLLAIESWVIYGIFGFSLVYAAPIAFLLFMFHSYFYHTLLEPILISIIATLLSLSMQGFLLGLAISTPYAIGTIFANIGVITVFSLKAIKGKTRQSLILNRA
jgi:hypothetical protein